MDKILKRTILFASISLVLFILDFFIIKYLLPIQYLILTKVLIELAYFAFSVVIFINSIQLIKRKDLTLGIIFLVFSSLIILLVLFGFIMGFFLNQQFINSIPAH